MAKATKVEGNAKHNLINIGVLDTGVNMLEAMELSFAREGLSEFREAIKILRGDMFNAKMDMRREENL